MHPAVGAEDGADVVGVVQGDGPGDAADGLDDPDVAEVAEGDEFAVGRDVRRAGQADRFLGSAAANEQGQSKGRQDESEAAHEGCSCRCGCLKGSERRG